MNVTRTDFFQLLGCGVHPTLYTNHVGDGWTAEKVGRVILCFDRINNRKQFAILLSKYRARPLGWGEHSFVLQTVSCGGIGFKSKGGDNRLAAAEKKYQRWLKEDNPDERD